MESTLKHLLTISPNLPLKLNWEAPKQTLLATTINVVSQQGHNYILQVSGVNNNVVTLDSKGTTSLWNLSTQEETPLPFSLDLSKSSPSERKIWIKNLSNTLICGVDDKNGKLIVLNENGKETDLNQVIENEGKPIELFCLKHGLAAVCGKKIHICTFPHSRSSSEDGESEVKKKLHEIGSNRKIIDVCKGSGDICVLASIELEKAEHYITEFLKYYEVVSNGYGWLEYCPYVSTEDREKLSALLIEKTNLLEEVIKAVIEELKSLQSESAIVLLKEFIKERDILSNRSTEEFRKKIEFEIAKDRYFLSNKRVNELANYLNTYLLNPKFDSSDDAKSVKLDISEILEKLLENKLDMKDVSLEVVLNAQKNCDVLFQKLEKLEKEMSESLDYKISRKDKDRFNEIQTKLNAIKKKSSREAHWEDISVEQVWTPGDASSIKDIYSQYYDVNKAKVLLREYKELESEWYIITLLNNNYCLQRLSTFNNESYNQGFKSLYDAFKVELSKINQAFDKWKTLTNEKKYYFSYFSSSGERLLSESWGYEDCSFFPTWMENNNHQVKITYSLGVEKTIAIFPQGFILLPFSGEISYDANSNGYVIPFKDVGGRLTPSFTLKCAESNSVDNEIFVVLAKKIKDESYTLLIFDLVSRYSTKLKFKHALRLLPEGNYNKFDISPNGNFLVTNMKNDVVVININTLQNIVIGSHEMEITDIYWDVSGEFIISTGKEGTLKKWDTREEISFEIKSTSTLSNLSSTFCQFSDDNKALVIKNSINTTQIIDTETNRRIFYFPGDVSGYSRGESSLTWSPDKKLLVSFNEEEFSIIRLDYDLVKENTKDNFPKISSRSHSYFDRHYDSDRDSKLPLICKNPPSLVWSSDSKFLVSIHVCQGMVYRQDENLSSGVWVFVWDVELGAEIMRYHSKDFEEIYVKENPIENNKGKTNENNKLNSSPFLFQLLDSVLYMINPKTNQYKSLNIVTGVTKNDKLEFIKKPRCLYNNGKELKVEKEGNFLLIDNIKAINCQNQISCFDISKDSKSIAIGDSFGNTYFIDVEIKEEKPTPKEISKIVFDINTRDESNATPLFKACKTLNSKAISELLNRGGDPLLVCNGMNCIHIAAKFGNDLALQLIVEHFVKQGKQNEIQDILERPVLAEGSQKNDFIGWRAMHIASLYCRSSCIAFLFHHGSSITGPNPDGKTPFQIVEKSEWKMLTYVGSCSSTSNYNKSYIDCLKLLLPWRTMKEIETFATNFSVASHGKRRSYYYNFDNFFKKKSHVPSNWEEDTLKRRVALFISTHRSLFPEGRIAECGEVITNYIKEYNMIGNSTDD